MVSREDGTAIAVDPTPDARVIVRVDRSGRVAVTVLTDESAPFPRILVDHGGKSAMEKYAP